MQLRGPGRSLSFQTPKDPQGGQGPSRGVGRIGWLKDRAEDRPGSSERPGETSHRSSVFREGCPHGPCLLSHSPPPLPPQPHPEVWGWLQQAGSFVYSPKGLHRAGSRRAVFAFTFQRQQEPPPPSLDDRQAQAPGMRGERGRGLPPTFLLPWEGPRPPRALPRFTSGIVQEGSGPGVRGGGAQAGAQAQEAHPATAQGSDPCTEQVSAQYGGGRAAGSSGFRAGSRQVNSTGRSGVGWGCSPGPFPHASLCGGTLGRLAVALREDPLQASEPKAPI